MVVIETNSDLYFEIRGKFLRGNPNRWRLDRHEERIASFKQFIEDNGGELNEDWINKDKTYGIDSLGIIPGITTIVFNDEKLYTMFMLKCV